uniref:Uncharacterized protein n=1 Tax=Cacopsylla melanoneura TaxID=428564 RepID=A0A8D8UFA3_9HEMI
MNSVRIRLKVILLYNIIILVVMWFDPNGYILLYLLLIFILLSIFKSLKTLITKVGNQTSCMFFSDEQKAGNHGAGRQHSPHHTSGHAYNAKNPPPRGQKASVFTT